MFYKILAAIDNSAIGKQVFQKSLAIAKAMGASLMLLHVLSPEEEGAPDLSMPLGLEYAPVIANEVWEMHHKQWQEFARKSVAFLRACAEEAKAAGINAEFTQNPGSPGRSICQFAQTWNADLIIIGRRGRSGLSEMLLGSVSNYVIHHAPCSVLTIHDQNREASAASQPTEETMAVS